MKARGSGALLLAGFLLSLAAPPGSEAALPGLGDLRDPPPAGIQAFTYPPRYRAAGQEVWDFWYAQHTGTFHAFYLQSPAGFANSTVGLATSKDLIHWTEHGEILRANPPGQWNDAWIATGTVWGQAGDWRMLYTGQTYSYERGFGLATSPDLLNWTKVGTGPVQFNYQPFVVPSSPYWQGKGYVAGATLSHVVLADPYVLPDPIDGWFYLVANSLFDLEPPETRGCITLWRSQDGRVWEDLGVIAAPRIYDQMEAPQLWKRGDRWYLLFGAARQTPVYRATMIYTAPTMFGPFEPSPAPEITLYDTSDWFYLAKIISNAYGEHTLLGGLGGSLSHPYSVLYEPDGSVRIGAYESSFPHWAPGGVTGIVGPLVRDFAGGMIAAGEHRLNANGAQVWAQTGIRPGTRWASDARGGAVGTTAASNEVWGMRTTHSGSLPWGTSVRVCGAPGPKRSPVVAPDGQGGALFAWMDPRGGGSAPDIYVQRVDSAGVVKWTADGVAVGAAGGVQDAPAIVSDGAGGALLAWRDARPGAAGGSDLYAQRINSTGTPQWTVNGLAVCVAAGAEDAPVLESDGAGGAWLVWSDARGGDRDVYVQRLNSGGVPAFAANGILVGGGVNDQRVPAIAPDGAGGRFVAWQDHRAGGVEGIDLYAQRVSPSGALLWEEDGEPISAAAGRQVRPAIVGDGSGGMIAAWMDSRDNTSGTTTYFLPYALRVDGNGAPLWAAGGVRVDATGTGVTTLSAPSIVADDEGGAFLMWTAGLHRVRNDGRLGWMQTYGPVITSVSDEPDDQGGAVRITIASPYAEIASFAPAISNYQVWRKAAPAPMEFRHSGGRIVPFSRNSPASAAAGPPAGWEVVGSFAPTGAWNYSVVAPTRADSSGAGFASEEYCITATIASPTYVVAGNAVTGYSVDNFRPNPIADVAPTSAPLVTDLGRCAPNPMSVVSRIEYGLARAGTVSLSIFDLNGRRVRSLVEGRVAAGVWRAGWDGADDSGRRLAAGVYLVRFAAGGVQRTAKIVVAR